VLSTAADIPRQFLGPDPPYCAYAVFTLGSVYISLGEFERAEQENLQALRIRAAAYGPCGRLVGDSYNSLGFIYREMGQAQRSVHAHERALAIRAAWLGAEDPLVAQ